jgi:hypothetical protein
VPERRPGFGRAGFVDSVPVAWSSVLVVAASMVWVDFPGITPAVGCCVVASAVIRACRLGSGVCGRCSMI